MCSNSNLCCNMSLTMEPILRNAGMIHDGSVARALLEEIRSTVLEMSAEIHFVQA